MFEKFTARTGDKGVKQLVKVDAVMTAIKLLTEGKQICYSNLRLFKEWLKNYQEGMRGSFMTMLTNEVIIGYGECKEELVVCVKGIPKEYYISLSQDEITLLINEINTELAIRDWKHEPEWCLNLKLYITNDKLWINDIYGFNVDNASKLLDAYKTFMSTLKTDYEASSANKIMAFMTKYKHTTNDIIAFINMLRKDEFKSAKYYTNEIGVEITPTIDDNVIFVQMKQYNIDSYDYVSYAVTVCAGARYRLAEMLETKYIDGDDCSPEA